jgi:hypothetical protein
MVACSAALVALLLLAAATAKPLWRIYRAWRYPPEYRLVIYDVQDLCGTPPDICSGLPIEPAPVVRGLAPSEEDPRPPGAAAEVVEAVRRCAGPDGWLARGTSLAERQGKLVVVHTSAVHRKISDCLAGMRNEASRSVEVEAVFLKGAGLAALLTGRRTGPEARWTTEEVSGLLAAAGRHGIPAVRPSHAAYLGGGWSRDLKEPAVRCVNRGVQRLTSIESYRFPDGPDGREEFVNTGFALEIRPIFPGAGPEVELHMRASHCALLPAGAGALGDGGSGGRRLDERDLRAQLTVTEPGWVALVLNAPGAGSPPEPVLVLVGVRPAAEAPEEERKLL